MHRKERISRLLCVFAVLTSVSCRQHSSVPNPGTSLPQPGTSLPQPGTSLPQPGTSLAQPRTSENAAAKLPDTLVITIKSHGQETEQWCWAASAQTIMDTIGTSKDIRQCTQVMHLFSATVKGDCCHDKLAKGCVNPAWPDFEYFGFSTAAPLRGGLSWDQLREQIATKRRPFAFTWDWDGGNSHMQVAFGYKVQDGQRLVRVFNPLPINDGFSKWITYEEYIQTPGDHSHSLDYYDVEPLQPQSLATKALGFREVRAPPREPTAQPLAVWGAEGGYLIRTSGEGGSSSRKAETPLAQDGVAAQGDASKERDDSNVKAQSPPGAVPRQTPAFKAALIGAQDAIKMGLQKMAPQEFLHPPPGAKPTSVGSAAGVVNLKLLALLGPKKAALSDRPSAESVKTIVTSALNSAPSEISVPVVGPNNRVGVMSLRGVNGHWIWYSFEEDTPLSQALSVTVDTTHAVTQANGGTVLGEAGPSPPGAITGRQLNGIVNVKGLNVSFLAIKDKNGLQFQPLWDAPYYGFKAGQLVPAQKALKTLQEKGTYSDAPQ
jgi:hypothetical protein